MGGRGGGGGGEGERRRGEGRGGGGGGGERERREEEGGRGRVGRGDIGNGGGGRRGRRGDHLELSCTGPGTRKEPHRESHLKGVPVTAGSSTEGSACPDDYDPSSGEQLLRV